MDREFNTNHNCLLKATEVARILNISRALAYRLMQIGRIPVVRINRAVRVKPEDLDRYIESCRSGAIEDTML
jgi:excisionase family DNA binding protein